MSQLLTTNWIYIAIGIVGALAVMWFCFQIPSTDGDAGGRESENRMLRQAAQDSWARSSLNLWSGGFKKKKNSFVDCVQRHYTSSATSLKHK